ncbi:glutathione hydrolase 7 [Scleropages formosus]|uniref:Glutathione hydrolase n=1 Tax=Scleropages formosus TaxID=113540 RepID=A0A8D0CIB0_SCLFO|nr:glutathione hydrolase 7 [Scleropages formosus]XP_029103181.1 glutathione hydrolase 7 [Scleropages formosus]
MFSPAADTVSGYAGGNMADKDAGQDTTLGSAYSPVDYMSITSFPRLPEEDVLSSENALRSRKDDDHFLSEQDTDPDLFLKSARLQRLPSSASDLASHDATPLRETHRDPLAEDCTCRQDGLTIIITACLTFATGVTIALIVQIYVGDPQIFNQGAVVTDVAQCTSLGFDVLNKQGSSVDAAVVAALCLGIIHPHTSGIGGGGVMLVHDIRKNISRVIDFRETAPFALREEMLQSSLEQKPGLLVGVPGMLSGMHQAHQLYGRLSWKEVVTMAADVGRNGFNVTHDLAEALSHIKDTNMSENFRNVFLPDGQLPLSGMFVRRLDLAAILDSVAENGASEFYNGNLTQEMVAEIRAKGGVVTEEDFSNYSTALQQPVESLYQGHQILVAPAPHAGAALIMALNILEGFNITSQAPRNNTYHLIAESLKIALSMARGLGDPMFDSSVSEVVAQMISKSQAALLRQMINESQAAPPGHYTSFYGMESGGVASQVMVMGPDDFIVSVMSSLNRPFGSGIVTSSGVLLNSQILDFSWPNKTQGSSQPNPKNAIQPGKRPLSFLLPTAVRPSLGLCGTYVAVGSSNWDRALSGITQVLTNVLSFRKNLSESLSYGRLHPQLDYNVLLVDSEFLEEDIEVLQMKGHVVHKVDVLSLVEGTRRTNDLIIGVKDPRSADASAITMSMP